jgi:hypothetical protein
LAPKQEKESKEGMGTVFWEHELEMTGQDGMIQEKTMARTWLSLLQRSMGLM